MPGAQFQNMRANVLPQMPVPADERVELSCSNGRAVLRYWVAPISGSGRATVEFEGCRKIILGAPNDEALGGHRLAQHGLVAFAFHEVTSSDLIAELVDRNRVHQRHSDALFSGLRHFLATFKDETFECVALTIAVTHDKEVDVL